MGLALAGIRAYKRARSRGAQWWGTYAPPRAAVMQSAVLVFELAGASAFVAGVALLSVPAALMVGGALAILVIERQ